MGRSPALQLTVQAVRRTPHAGSRPAYTLMLFSCFRAFWVCGTSHTVALQRGAVCARPGVGCDKNDHFARLREAHRRDADVRHSGHSGARRRSAPVTPNAPKPPMPTASSCLVSTTVVLPLFSYSSQVAYPPPHRSRNNTIGPQILGEVRDTVKLMAASARAAGATRFVAVATAVYRTAGVSACRSVGRSVGRSVSVSVSALSLSRCLSAYYITITSELFGQPAARVAQ